VTGSSEFVSCLVRFHGPDPSARRAAADDLAEWEAVDPLVEGLKDRNPGVQEAVMAALIRIDGARVVASLVSLLCEDANTRNLAIEVLEQTGGGALDLLLPYAWHADPISVSSS
jgi:HEAT repeat protein